MTNLNEMTKIYQMVFGKAPTNLSITTMIDSIQEQMEKAEKNNDFKIIALQDKFNELSFYQGLLNMSEL